MSLLNRFLKQLKAEKPSGQSYSFGSVDYTIPSIPCIIEKRNDPWVYYGADNLYPYKVSDLRNGSPIHNSIIKTKSKMTAGDGFLINGALNIDESKAKIASLPSAVKSEFELLMKNPYNEESFLAVHYKICNDLEEQGQCAYEVIFNSDFSKIVRIKYLNVQNVRAGKMEGNKVKSYWYSRDWSRTRLAEFKPVEIFTFTGSDKEHLNQIVFEKQGNNDYYGELPYKGCLTWIMTDFKMGLFHLSNIDNGMNPGIWFKFYKVPKNETEKQNILDELKRKYEGATKTNKMVVTFSEGKELAPDIAPVANTNLDKQLLLLAELCDKKILTGHQLTSPLLAGISVAGQLGGNTELKTAYQIFDNTTMEQERKFIERSYSKILDYNKLPITLEINPFDPFKVRQTGTNTVTNGN